MFKKKEEEILEKISALNAEIITKVKKGLRLYDTGREDPNPDRLTEIGEMTKELENLKKELVILLLREICEKLEEYDGSELRKKLLDKSRESGYEDAVSSFSEILFLDGTSVSDTRNMDKKKIITEVGRYYYKVTGLRNAKHHDYLVKTGKRNKGNWD